MDKKKFFPQINIIKAIASFSVTAVHFRNRVETTIPESLINQKIKLFFSLNYSFFIFAVPLFLLATGFLSIHREINKKHFIGVIKIYFLYLFMAFMSYSLMIYTDTRNFTSILDIINRALKFNLISGWYIEMYVFLALIIPFLNILIKNLTKNEFKQLIIILLFAISIPAFINANPDFKILYLPNYWKPIYPIIYYFIGAYFRLYYEDFKMKNATYFMIYFSSVIYISQLLYRHASPYTKSFEGYYASIINVLLASSFFIFIFNTFDKSNFIIDNLSKYTLSTYIMAYPIDKIIYPYFVSIFKTTKYLLIASPLVVIIAYILTFFSGIILYELFNYIWSFFEKKLLNNFIE